MKTITLNNETKMPIIGLGTFLSSTGEAFINKAKGYDKIF